ncbi:MAG: L-threonylcarbamoyladenylate synthase [Spirochaetaceae bacterium]|nr:L-threonylcarbamoyladenylate synthase [Spirochaetaceae bacterium]
MKILKEHSDSAETAAGYIKNGGVVIIPTDTIYGFSSIVGDGGKKIRAIKGRAETKPFIELVDSVEATKSISSIEIPEKLLRCWPGALTVIVPRKEELGGGTVALRCPGDEWLRKVISLAGRGIYSTSVNRSGSAPMLEVNDIIKEFESEVDLIVCDGDTKGGTASTLVDITSGSIKVLRQGSVKI